MLDELIQERRKKLERIQSAGVSPYPASVPRTATAAEVIANFESWSSENKTVSVVGRIMAIRNQGQIAFLDVRDESGKLQAVLDTKTTESCVFWLDNLDRGDFASFTGTLFRTKKGEMSVQVVQVVLASKSLRPLPTEWYGVEDEELRLRERYVELALEPDLREMFRKKSRFWQATREYLLKENFLEVDTPVLEPIPGGAEAEPFVTHHNALDVDFYLRISPELNLKRLIAGGYERVFEIGRIFRNEGIDREHLQDYTQMEMYWAYQDYQGLMRFVEDLTRHAIRSAFGNLLIKSGDYEANWELPWQIYDYCALFREHNDGLDCLIASEVDLTARARAVGAKPEPTDRRGRLIDLIYKKTVRPKLLAPGYLIDPPVDIEPLAKRKPDDPRRVERFQIVAYGTELGKGFSELNDPIDQLHRFEEQQKLREAGDLEAQFLDEDFLHALEYGMPPTAGFAYSERLFSVLAGKPIRECVFFPLMRPKD